jgi:hypothetical protein
MTSSTSGFIYSGLKCCCKELGIFISTRDESVPEMPFSGLISLSNCYNFLFIPDQIELSTWVEKS